MEFLIIIRLNKFTTHIPPASAFGFLPAPFCSLSLTCLREKGYVLPYFNFYLDRSFTQIWLSCVPSPEYIPALSMWLCPGVSLKARDWTWFSSFFLWTLWFWWLHAFPSSSLTTLLTNTNTQNDSYPYKQQHSWVFIFHVTECMNFISISYYSSENHYGGVGLVTVDITVDTSFTVATLTVYMYQNVNLFQSSSIYVTIR